MSRRRIMQSQGRELPSGYMRCKYLESSGTQWIDTGIIPEKSNVIEFTFMTLEYSASPFGCLNFTIVVDAGGTTFTRFFNNVGTRGFAKMCKNNIYNLKYTSEKVSLSENSNPIKCTTTVGTYSANGTLWLFGRSDLKNTYKCRFYSCSIDNILGLIPALDPSGKPCMYDTVTHQPFYNQGTGEFLYKLA